MKLNGLINKVLQTLGNNKGIIFQSAFAFIVRVIGSIIGFVTTIIVSNKLGAMAAGYYFLALGIVTVFSALGRVGTDSTIIRFIGAANGIGDKAVISGTLKAAFIVACIASIVASILLAISSDAIAMKIFNKPELGSILRAISPAVLFTSIFTVFSMTLQGLQRTTESVAISNIFANLILIILIFFYDEPSPNEVASLYNVACFITALIAGWIVKSILFERDNITINWRDFFDSCIPLWTGVLLLQCTQLTGQIMTGIFNDANDVAMLAVAQKTASLISFILVVVNLIVAPKFAVLYKQERYAELNRLALVSIRVLAIIALPIIILTLTYPQMIMAIFGPEFKDGKHLLQILVFGQAVNVLTGSVGYLLSMSGNERDLRNSFIISAPLTMFLCIILIPVYGPVGAAAATAIGFSIQSLIPAYWVYKRLGINIMMFWK